MRCSNPSRRRGKRRAARSRSPSNSFRDRIGWSAGPWHPFDRLRQPVVRGVNDIADVVRAAKSALTHPCKYLIMRLSHFEKKFRDEPVQIPLLECGDGANADHPEKC